MLNKPLTVLNIKDPHFRGEFKPPVGREDDFKADIDSKIEQVVNICKREKVDLITIAGDVFDIKQSSKYDPNKISSILKMINKLKEATNLNKILTIAGNHDLPNSSVQMKEKSVYQLFVDAGVLQDINKEYTIDTKFGVVHFKGFDYQTKVSILKRKLRLYHKKINKTNKHFYNILIHEHIVPSNDKSRELKYLGSNMSYESIRKIYPRFNVWFCGHFHKGYDTTTVGNQTIVNPWNFTRLARNNYVLNDEHIPNVTIVKYGPGGVEAKDISLVVRDYRITNIDILEEDKEQQMDISGLLEQLSRTSIEDKELKIKLNRSQKLLLKDILNQAKDNTQE